MTVLEPAEILTAIRIPNKWAGAKFYFEKVTDRQSWDFPLVNVAAAVMVKDGTIADARVACGGVEAHPRYLGVVADVVKGKKQDAEVAGLASATVARGARPLNYNHFKIPLMQNLVKRAIRDAA